MNYGTSSVVLLVLPTPSHGHSSRARGQDHFLHRSRRSEVGGARRFQHKWQPPEPATTTAQTLLFRPQYTSRADWWREGGKPIRKRAKGPRGWRRPRRDCDSWCPFQIAQAGKVGWGVAPPRRSLWPPSRGAGYRSASLRRFRGTGRGDPSRRHGGCAAGSGVVEAMAAAVVVGGGADVPVVTWVKALSASLTVAVLLSLRCCRVSLSPRSIPGISVSQLPQRGPGLR